MKPDEHRQVNLRKDAALQCEGALTGDEKMNKTHLQ